MHFEIVTPTGRLLSTEVDELTAPGTLGEFGVLPGHIPFIGGIEPGVVRWRRGGETGTLAVGNGLLEVAPGDRVVLLTQRGAAPDKIDAATARAELVEAQKQLDHWEGGEESERAELERTRAWAQAQLDALGASPTAAAH